MQMNDLIGRMRLLFCKDKELFRSLYQILGFYPRHIEYYKTAMLHSSLAKRNEKGRPVNNERLEFLGDAVLGAAVSHVVYNHFPGKREGFLTTTRSKLVQRDTLGLLAREMGIDNLLINNTQNNHNHNNYMGGNAFEALVGAIYLDQGYNACMKFVKKRILKQMINIDKMAYKEVNFKSKLLEWAQKNRVQLEFQFLGEEKGDKGSPKFSHQVLIEGVKGPTAAGYSKKESQQKAAKLTLEELRRKPQFIDAVFAAKSNRTKMEEEPATAVPVIEEEKIEDLLKKNNKKELEKSAPKPETAAKEENFDLSDITNREPSREDIIAAAEAAAYES